MKRIGGLFEKVCSFENLLIAYKKAFKGSGKNRETCKFSYFMEREIFSIREEMINGNYYPGKYRYFKINEPKERVISVAPFRDRIVHHAIVNILEPIFDPRFIYDSYATRKEKGVHAAVKRAQLFLRQRRFYLKFDVNKYFDNIDHRILLNLLKRKIKDKELERLLLIIISNSDVSRGERTCRGLPIGNLTSQFFANIYLDLFDHYVKEELRIKRYVRYMDDCAIFHESKIYLKSILKEIDLYLQIRLKLELKKRVTVLNSSLNGMSFLGYRIFPALIRLKRENVKRLRKKILQKEIELSKGIIDEESFRMSVNSLMGFAKFADSLQLRKKMFNNGAKV